MFSAVLKACKQAERELKDNCAILCYCPLTSLNSHL